MVIKREAPNCPQGFDCAFFNSCPAFYVPCPAGYFCSSYQGFPDQDEMDFQYATMSQENSDVDVTWDDMEYYIPANRTIQSKCLQKFHCESAYTMSACPEGNWCPESTIEPQSCDGIFTCPSLSSYQLNFTNLVISIIFAMVAIILSFKLTRDQAKREEKSRSMVGMKRSSATSPNNSNSKSTVGQKDIDTIIEVQLLNIEYSIPMGSEKKVILPGFTATIPAGKMTLLLGPSGSGKTSLLNVIHKRKYGENLSGKVQFMHRPFRNNTTAHMPSFPVEETPYTSNTDEIYSPLLAGQHADSVSMEVFMLGQGQTNLIGFVPQEDIMDRKLTVRELLTLQAICRNDGMKLTSEEVTNIVEGVMDDLGILHIADAVIGGGENAAANISGGQLKRVNIACELVALGSPAILLLDEITSGLDAAVAFDLIETIDKLKHRGVTILCVLQQPRHEIFLKMDHLILINQIGQIVYEGKVESAASTLRDLGFSPFSEFTNDADFCIDVLNTIDPHNNPQTNRIESTITVTQHPNHSYSRTSVEISNNAQNLREINYSIPSVISNRHNELTLPLLEKSIKLGQKGYILLKSPQFYYHILLNAQRLATIRLRDRLQLFVYILINIVMAVSLSSGFSILVMDSYYGVLAPPVRSELQAYYPSPLARYSGHNVNSFSLDQLLFFMGAALGCASCLTAVPVFSGMRNVMVREHAGGVSYTAMGLGRMIGDLPFVFVNAMAFCGVWCAFGMPGAYSDWMAVIVSTAFAASSIGYLAAAMSTEKNASVHAIISTFVCCVFSGTDPTLKQVERYNVLVLPYYLSFATWTSEGTYVTWSNYLSDNGNVPEATQQGADVYGYDVSNGLGRSVGILICLGILFRLFVLIILNTYS